MADRDEVLGKLAHLRRRAYRPALEAGDGVATDCKLGGTPYLTEAARWPRCDGCGEPMALLLQLNPSQLPEPLRKQWGGDLIQLFGCAGCSAHRARQVAVAGDGVEPDARPSGAPEPRVIRSWSAVDDYPSAAERASLGVELEGDEAAIAADLTCAGVKLSGWPSWAGAVAYPTCGLCGKPTRLVMQLESGALTQCASHKSTLAFVEPAP